MILPSVIVSWKQVMWIVIYQTADSQCTTKTNVNAKQNMKRSVDKSQKRQQKRTWKVCAVSAQKISEPWSHWKILTENKKILLYIKTKKNGNNYKTKMKSLSEKQMKSCGKINEKILWNLKERKFSNWKRGKNGVKNFWSEVVKEGSDRSDDGGGSTQSVAVIYRFFPT